MSEFLAEAKVLVRPDTTQFRAELTAQLAALKVAPIVVPVIAGAAGGLATAATATAALNAAQRTAQASTLGLASAAQVESSAFGKQAVILGAVTAQTEALAGAQAIAAKTTAGSTAALLGAGSATGRLDAALLGLRTAVGSSAVIGLSALALGAIAAGKALRSIISSTSALEVQLSTFRVTAGATSFEMQQVAEEARKLGADVALPGVSALDAAEAMSELSKAGLSVQDSIEGARGVLQLATAATIDVATATELAANALNAFGLSGSQAVHVADLLAGASIAAQGSIADMGIALQQAAAVGRQVGLSLEATITFLAILAKNGLRASDAGTSLRTALLRLVNPTDEAKRLLQGLGIAIRDVSGAVRVDVFSQLGAALRDMGAAQRDATLATIFGQDAIRSASILAREGIGGFQEVEKTVTKQGQAAEIAAAKSEGLRGAWENLKNQASTLGQRVGEEMSPTLQLFVTIAADAIEGTNKLDKAMADLSSTRAPESVKEIVDEIVRLNEVLRRAQEIRAEAAIADLQRQIAELSQELRGKLNPALLENADAAERAAASMGFVGTAMADAASRASEAARIFQELQEKLRAAGGMATTPQLLEAQIGVAEAAGNEDEVLRLERIRLARRRAFLRKRQAIARADPTAKNVQLVEEAAANVKASEDRIRAIEERRASDSRRAAEDIARAASEADRAVLSRIDLEGRRRANAVSRAALTERLSDDIATARALVAYYNRALKIAQDSIKDAKTRAQEIASLRAGLIAAERALDQAEQSVAEARRRRNQERRARREEGLQLDIQIAEATGNIKKEIKARQEYIKWLERQIRITRGNQRKRYLLALRQEQAELRDIRNQQRKTGDEFRRLTFDFLTMQQGFAANLFGNLIPTSFTGLVGTPAPSGGTGRAAAAAREIPMGLRRAEAIDRGGPGADLERERALARAGEGGMTRGQAATEIDVLKSINRGIQQLLRGLGFKEAQHQREKTAQSSGGGGVQVQ